MSTPLSTYLLHLVIVTAEIPERSRLDRLEEVLAKRGATAVTGRPGEHYFELMLLAEGASPRAAAEAAIDLADTACSACGLMLLSARAVDATWLEVVAEGSTSTQHLGPTRPVAP